MYIKLKNNEIEKYPYDINQLYIDNPDTSFPAQMPNERLAEWDVYPVEATENPTITYKQNLTEDTPKFIKGKWVQVWTISNKSQEEINAIHEKSRKDAYREESDPLFFKWQRGEATEQEWLDKVAEIKQRWS